MVGGPEEMRRQAARVAAEAARVRDVAARVSATRAVPWQSPAASAFRDSVTLCVVSLHRTAELLDAAAQLLHAHAAAVESVLDALPLVGASRHPPHGGGGR
jgi:hypothetical protein